MTSVPGALRSESAGTDEFGTDTESISHNNGRTLDFRTRTGNWHNLNITIYNTLRREKEVFEPLDPDRVTMYVCGPTVYNYAHIGNARPAVIFDVFYRLLKLHYPNVIYARNITDVDDKINATAAEEGVDIQTVSQRYTDAYHADMAAVGVGQPTIEPRATQHIRQMQAMISKLIDDGHAYEAEGHVLFSIESFENYGGLSRRDMREMVAGARLRVRP